MSCDEADGTSVPEWILSVYSGSSVMTESKRKVQAQNYAS